MTGKTERVVVTGMGVASPLGCNVEEFWQALIAGKSGVASLEGGPFSGMHSNIGAVVRGLEDGTYFDSKEARRMSRSSQLGIVAADQAIAQANLENGNISHGPGVFSDFSLGRKIGHFLPIQFPHNKIGIDGVRRGEIPVLSLPTGDEAKHKGKKK